MKPITITQETKEEAIKRFTEYLDKTRFTNNTIDFTYNISGLTNQQNIIKPTLYISATAYMKMMIYVRDTDTEIAWHGTVERYPDRNAFFIKDVFLYPQKLSAATVQTDQEKYNKWLEDLDDETYNHLRFQGHSHVNFAVTPSGTDLQYYKDILNVLPKNDYYIFIILNKTGAITALIYDLATNIIYETQDITIKLITQNSQDAMSEITAQKELYCEKPVYNYNRYQDYDFYKTRFEKEMEKDTPTFNEIDDELDSKYNKYKNKSLSPLKIIKKNKVKGVK